MSFYKTIRFWAIAAVCVAGIVFAAVRHFDRVGVTVVELKRQDLAITVTATSTGTVKADQEVRISARRPGTVKRLLVEEGSVLNQGDLVAELESEESMNRLSASDAAFHRMTATLSSLRLGLEAFRTEVESTIRKSAAILDETGSRLKKFKELMEKGYIPQLELDALTREYDVARAGHMSALAAREQVRAKEEEIRAQEAAVRQTESERSLGKIQYEYSFIRTSLAGVVTSRPVKVGDTVPAGALIAAVVSPDSLYIEAFIDEADVAAIRVGQQVHIGFDAYTGRVFAGEVFLISPVVLGGKQEARTFEVRVKLLDSGVAVKPGMSADVEIVVDRVADALVAPSQAIVEKAEGRFVYAVRKGKAVLIPVKTGRVTWNLTEITDGLAEGDAVISNLEAAGLEDGARVKVLKSGK